MDVASFCAESRVLVVAGKGGVGKTTVTAALARMAATAGLSVLVIELEGKSGLSEAFGAPGPLGYGTTEFRTTTPGPVRARRITPDDALLEYLERPRPAAHLPTPGLLGRHRRGLDGHPGDRATCWSWARSSSSSSPRSPTWCGRRPGHRARRDLPDLGQGLLDSARGGPVRTQAAEVVEMLSDPARCRVLLVTLPEEMPVSETIEAAYQLEDRAGVQLGPVVVNAWDRPAGGPRDEPPRRRPAGPG